MESEETTAPEQIDPTAESAEISLEGLTTEQKIDLAHQMLNDGKRDEARVIAEKILAKEPANFMAQALRDRIDNEDFSVAIVKERDRDIDDEDESPVVPIGLLILSIAAAVVATILTIRTVIIGFTVGFDTEVSGKTSLVLPGKGHYPVQNFLVYPVALYIIAAIGFYGYRRYRKT